MQKIKARNLCVVGGSTVYANVRDLTILVDD